VGSTGAPRAAPRAFQWTAPRRLRGWRKKDVRTTGKKIYAESETVWDCTKQGLETVIFPRYESARCGSSGMRRQIRGSVCTMTLTVYTTVSTPGSTLSCGNGAGSQADATPVRSRRGAYGILFRASTECFLRVCSTRFLRAGSSPAMRTVRRDRPYITQPAGAFAPNGEYSRYDDGTRTVCSPSLA
jgi:hypothetical protein